MAIDCQAVASKLKRGQLKITNQSKRTQTGYYCLETDTVLVQGLTPTQAAPVTSQEDKGSADIHYKSKGETLQMPQKSRYSFKFNQC